VLSRRAVLYLRRKRRKSNKVPTSGVLSRRGRLALEKGPNCRKVGGGLADGIQGGRKDEKRDKGTGRWGGFQEVHKNLHEKKFPNSCTGDETGILPWGKINYRETEPPKISAWDIS